jgi:hypothetical protein
LEGLAIENAGTYTLLPFGPFSGHFIPVIFYGAFVYFVVIWCMYFPRVGILYHGKSGNPVSMPKTGSLECK